VTLAEVYHTRPVALRADADCPVAAACERHLWAAGVAVRRYDDGRSLEADIRAGRVGCVIEMTLADVPADPERLTAAAEAGVAMVIAPPALTGGPRELDGLGRDVALRASASRGPVTVLLRPGLPPEFGQSLRNWVGPNVAVRAAGDLATDAASAGQGVTSKRTP
jgi:hypothetical protein